MDIPKLKFTQTTFRRGYRPDEVDQFLDLVATDLALPLASRSLGAAEVKKARFHSTMVRTGYDEREVDYVLDELSIQLGLPLPAELPDGSAPTDPPHLPSPPTSVPPTPVPIVATGHPATDDPSDDLRPDPTF